MPFTEQQIKMYTVLMECPYCKSCAVSDLQEDEDNEFSIFKHKECDDCGKTWYDEYDLTSIHEEND